MKTLDPLAGIAVFLTIAEALSFSRAAEQLGMSRATVSVQLRQLEMRLGVRLLQRNTRSVNLTEAGQIYLRALEGVLPQVQAADQEIRAVNEEAIGHIRLSAPPDLGQLFVAPLLADFITKYPNINVEMELSLEAVDLVGRGFDLAIRGTIAVDENLIVRRLMSSRLVACASPAYLAAAEPVHVPADLQRQAILHFAPLRWGRSWHFEKGPIREQVNFTPRIETNDSVSLKAAVLRGAGIALLPSYVVWDALQNGSLVSLLPDWTAADLEIYAVYPAYRHIAAKVRTLVNYLARTLQMSLSENDAHSLSEERRSPQEVDDQP
ncbi:LysR family transcriptional regulator [Rhizobium sp.]|uniref:LysR family transcriptional regulator n=1 Tax=Rhizobium sp. TaxID=391 RepID=UPI0034C6A9B2